MTNQVNDAQFPIGKWTRPTVMDRAAWLESMRTMPARLTALVETMTASQIETPYRKESWTARQVIHHIADSHMQAYGRTKMALTEDTPKIKPYDEAEWAKLADNAIPVGTSLALIEGLHLRWLALLDSLTEAQWQRAFRHPATGDMTIELQVSLYAWHSEHHFAHVRSVAESVAV